MPPKAEPEKKKKELPVVLCGCGLNTYRAAPKGKKAKPQPIQHAPDCTFQKTTCNRYPHMPKCAACEIGCPFCAGINPWCPHCLDNHCQFQFKRDMMVLGIPKKVLAPEVVPDAAAEAAPAPRPKKAPAAAAASPK